MIDEIAHFSVVVMHKPVNLVGRESAGEAVPFSWCKLPYSFRLFDCRWVATLACCTSGVVGLMDDTFGAWLSFFGSIGVPPLDNGLGEFIGENLIQRGMWWDRLCG